MDLNGISCIVSDTAGLRELTSDPIELEGMKRAKEAFKEAQLKLFVCDPSNEREVVAAETMLKQLLREDMSIEDTIDGVSNEQRRLVLVLNKADLKVSPDSQSIISKMIDTSTKYNRETASDIQHTILSHIQVSCVHGTGIDELENLITATISEMFEKAGSASTEGVLITRDRHRRHLSECLRYLDNFLSDELPMDIAAEELR
jgi:tRNA modification GTPase